MNNQNWLMLILAIVVVFLLLGGEAKTAIRKNRSAKARPSNRQVQGDSRVISPDNKVYSAISAGGVAR